MNEDVLYLQDYLRDNGHEGLEKLGIQIGKDPRYPFLINLKYGVFADKNAMLTRVCRGAVIDTRDYSVKAYAFTRFFNIGEHQCSVIDWESSRVYQKYDGSLIKLFYYEGEWVVSTSGSVAGAGQVGSNSISFAELFWNTFDKVGYKKSYLDKSICYIFELCSRDNKVVVDYAAPKLVLLTARDTSTWHELELHGFSMYFEVAQLYNLFSESDAMQFTEQYGGRELEGVIVVDKYWNRAKIKSSTYVQMHNVKSNGCPSFIELYKSDNLAEFIDYFPEYSEEFDGYVSKIDEINQIGHEFVKKYANFDQKSFALALKQEKFLPQGFIFALRGGKISSFGEYLCSIPEKSAFSLIKSDV